MNNFNREYEVPRMSVIYLQQEDVITVSDNSNWDNWEIGYEDQF